MRMSFAQRQEVFRTWMVNQIVDREGKRSIQSVAILFWLLWANKQASFHGCLGHQLEQVSPPCWLGSVATLLVIFACLTRAPQVWGKDE